MSNVHTEQIPLATAPDGTACSTRCWHGASTNLTPPLPLAVIPTRSALADAARRYRSFAKTHPALYGLMFDRATPGWQPSPAVLAHAAASFGRLAGHVSKAMAAGALAGGDPAEVAQAG